MLKYIIALFLLLPATVWGGVFVGFGAVAETHPASGTLLAGLSTGADEGTTGHLQSVGLNHEVVTDTTYLATWSETATTTTAASIRVRVRGDDTTNVKCILRNASGGIVAQTNALATSYGSPNGTSQNLAFSSPPTITKGDYYRLSCIAESGYVNYGYQLDASRQLEDNTSGTYASPVTTLPANNGEIGVAAAFDVGLIK